jgi:hypothetical protein
VDNLLQLYCEALLAEDIDRLQALLQPEAVLSAILTAALPTVQDRQRICRPN